MRDMADNKLIGQNYTTPDLVAKVTGKAKYAEDYRVEGMLFCKLLVSPYPHARVKRIDTSAAMAYPGVKAIITVDELTAAEAVERIDIEFEPLPFAVDPIESLRPNGGNARMQGNVWIRPAAPPAAPGARGPANSARGADAAAPRTPTPTGPAGEQRTGAAGAAAGAARAGAGTAAEGGRRGPAEGARAGRAGGGAGAAAPAPPQVVVWKWTDDDFA